MLGVLSCLCGSVGSGIPTVDFATGQRLLAQHTLDLLGPASPGRDTRIMVTMPSEAARDFVLVRDCLLYTSRCV